MTASYFPFIAMSNTASWSENSDYKLVHLIDKGHDVYFDDYGIADNGSLFVQGDVFTPSSYASSFPILGRFNDSSQIGYQITIVTLTANEATIKIDRI